MEKKPKYHPDENFVRLGQLKPGDVAEVFPAKGRYFAQEIVKVKEVVETKQERNSIVVTAGGRKYGGGTSSILRHSLGR